jgi:hypothetical protein
LNFLCHEAESVRGQLILDYSPWLYQRGNSRNTLFIVDSIKYNSLTTGLEVITIETFPAKDIYLFLMLSLCEDFDDDLLFDAINLLTSEN